MKSLFDQSSLEEIERRINQLTPDSQRRWGKMEVDQMLAHCVKPLKVASNETKIPRLFIGKLLGLFLSLPFTMINHFPKVVQLLRSLLSQTGATLIQKKRGYWRSHENFRQAGERIAQKIRIPSLDS